MTVEVTNEEKSLLLSQMVGAYLDVEDDTLKELSQQLRKMNNEIRSALCSTDYNTYYLLAEPITSGNIPIYLGEFIHLYLSHKLFRNDLFDDIAPIVANMHSVAFAILVNRTIDSEKDLENIKSFAHYLFNAVTTDFAYSSEIMKIAKNLVACIKGIEIDSKNIVTP